MAPSAMKTHVDSCPDLETLAAYIDGQLTKEARADVTQHLTGCETCYFVFTESAHMRPTMAIAEPAVEQPTSAKAAVTWWRSSKVIWSSAAGLAAAAVIVVA